MVRPHTIKFASTVEPAPTLDDNGNWVKTVTGTTNVEIPCRVEPNGQGRTIASEDGANILYSFRVWADRNAQTIPNGKMIELYDKTTKIGEGTVKRFFRNKFDVVIWV